MNGFSGCTLHLSTADGCRVSFEFKMLGDDYRMRTGEWLWPHLTKLGTSPPLSLLSSSFLLSPFLPSFLSSLPFSLSSFLPSFLLLPSCLWYCPDLLAVNIQRASCSGDRRLPHRVPLRWLHHRNFTENSGTVWLQQHPTHSKQDKLQQKKRKSHEAVSPRDGRQCCALALSRPDSLVWALPRLQTRQQAPRERKPSIKDGPAGTCWAARARLDSEGQAPVISASSRGPEPIGYFGIYFNPRIFGGFMSASHNLIYFRKTLIFSHLCIHHPIFSSKKSKSVKKIDARIIFNHFWWSDAVGELEVWCWNVGISEIYSGSEGKELQCRIKKVKKLGKSKQRIQSCDASRCVKIKLSASPFVIYF